MTRALGVSRRDGTVSVVLVVTGLFVGCRSTSPVDPVAIANVTLRSMTIAVAPALNQSGSSDFDPDRFADLMASELSFVDGVSVIPVSRVLGVMSTLGLKRVESPADALRLVDLLGADAILVFAVTEYDPYIPPSIGITAQLFGTRPGPAGGRLDPVALSRSPRLAASAAPLGPQSPLLAQRQRVFDASHSSVAADIRRFARLRKGDDSPYGWRKYAVSQQHFIRYCCHTTIKEMFGNQRTTVRRAVRRAER